MKFVSIALLGTVLSASAFATAPVPAPYSIAITKVVGKGCPDQSKISVVTDEAGNYSIDANFNEGQDVFTAESSPEMTTVRSDCTIDYKLTLNSRYQLDTASFLVDGQYNLSERGSAFFSVRHNVPGLGNPTFSNVSYTAPADLNGNFSLEGAIDGIDKTVNKCGATIPLQVQIRATARQAKADGLTTFVAVDNGEGDATAKRGFRRIKVFAKPVPCH